MADTQAVAPVRSETEPPALSVVIPMYREAHRIGPTLDDAIPWLRAWSRTSELILVNDGSPDDTLGAVGPYLTEEPEGALRRVSLVSYEANRGKGGAVREGLARATGSAALVMDADNAATIREIERLLPALGDGVGIVAGSRESDDAQVDAVAFRRLTGSIFRTALALMGMGVIRDTQCGYKLYTREAVDIVARYASEDGYIFDLEHMLLARKAGLDIAERGIRWAHVEGGQVHAMRDGVRMLAQSARLKARLRSVRIERATTRPAVTLEPKPSVRAEAGVGST